jgi:hydrogenase maturation protein HypF
MWRAILGDLGAGEPAAAIAARFHVALAEVTLRMAEGALSARPEVRAVALSGGCWQNKILLELVVSGLRARGRRVLVHEQLPPNDGCVAFGQSLVAAARAADRSR